MIKKILKKMDYVLVAIVVLLFLIGIVALYSANGGINGDTSEVTKQIIWFLVGCVGAILMIVLDYNTVGKFWMVIYGRNINFASCSFVY